MAFFLQWLVKAIADIVGKNVLTVTGRIAMAVAFTALLAAVSVAYIQAMKTLITGIGVTVPDVVSMAWSWVAPTNTNACFAAIVSARISKFLYVKYTEAIKARASIVAKQL